jgi:SAM-dependent methyltransferase
MTTQITISTRILLTALTLALLLPGGTRAALAQAAAQAPQAPAEPYVPQEGQEGKDVVWVPTPQALVERMLDIANVSPDDYLIDLGSGDGRTVITAAKRGLRAHGIEYNPDMVALARHRAAEAGVADRATFEEADLFEADLSKASVITMFLLPSINLELRPKLLELKPGTRIVSNTFTMEAWEPDERSTVEDDCTSWCTALLWIVPAKVAGTWRVGDQTLTLTQEFQMVSGTLGDVAIADGRLRGDVLTFTAGGRVYEGRVEGDAIVGTAGGSATFRAERVAR